MGKRLIRGWLEQPLKNVAEITLRLNAVDELVGNFPLLGETTEYLTGVKDIERLMSRIVMGTASGKELLQLVFPQSRRCFLPQTAVFLKLFVKILIPLQI